MLTYAEFRKICREQDATLVPIAKSVAADLLTPVSAFLSIAEKEKHAFLFESVEGGERVGRYTFLGVQPYLRITAHNLETVIDRKLHGRMRREACRGPLLEIIRGFLSEHRAAKVPGLPPFAGGAVGFVGYDLIRQMEKIAERAKDELKLPTCALMFFDRVLAFDHVKHQIQIIASVDVRGCERESDWKRRYNAAVRDIERLEAKLARGVAKPHLRRGETRRTKPLRVRPVTTRQKFMSDVRRAQEYIRAGDIFQVVLSQRFDFNLAAEPFEVYRALRTVNPSPYMYFLRSDDLAIVGSSPEMLVRAKGRQLEYRPIAGTRPRGATPEDDARIEAELRVDEKERAEHVMLVDLGRNDLGRVSEYGSVKVRELMFVERYSHVMHIVSALESQLRNDLTALDAFAACFPAGTLSGAPKVRAMQIIEELEPVRRGVYGGSVFYADFAGNLDSCIAIRTLVVRGKRASVQAGAGIVADSVPEREFDECVSKAKAVLRAVEAAQGNEPR